MPRDGEWYGIVQFNVPLDTHTQREREREREMVKVSVHDNTHLLLLFT